jgi:hypothetical protein
MTTNDSIAYLKQVMRDNKVESPEYAAALGALNNYYNRVASDPAGAGQMVRDTAIRIPSITADKKRRATDAAYRKKREHEDYLARPSCCHIGMTANEVRNSKRGPPDHINSTITQRGTSEQWVYDGGHYMLYFDDGVLTAIQEHSQ